MELNQSKINEIQEFMSLYSLSNSPFIEDDMEVYDEYKSMSDEEFCSEVDGRVRWLNTYYSCSSRFKELTDLFRNESREKYNDVLKKMLNTFSAEQLNYIADNHNYDESPRILKWVINSECCTVDVINTIRHLMLLDGVEEVDYTDEELAFIEKLKLKKMNLQTL